MPILLFHWNTCDGISYFWRVQAYWFVKLQLTLDLIDKCSNFFSAIKNIKAKRKNPFIGPFLPVQTIKAISPSHEGLPPEISKKISIAHPNLRFTLLQEYFQYKVFPLLHPELFSTPRLLHKEAEKSKPLNIPFDPINVISELTFNFAIIIKCRTIRIQWTITNGLKLC